MEGKRPRGRPRFGMIDDLKGIVRKDEEVSSGQWHGDVGCRDLPEGRDLMMMMMMCCIVLNYICID